MKKFFINPFMISLTILLSIVGYYFYQLPNRLEANNKQVVSTLKVYFANGVSDVLTFKTPSYAPLYIDTFRGSYSLRSYRYCDFKGHKKCEVVLKNAVQHFKILKQEIVYSYQDNEDSEGIVFLLFFLLIISILISMLITCLFYTIKGSSE